ncbi:MAG: thermonuclease family protein [Okeania sp. SIO2H7]|nr:thermonuclease family protein [Okeania sp. SIO2H7]
MKKLIGAIATCLFLASCQEPEMPQGRSVKVERVISGQTIEIVDNFNPVPTLQPVRLIGIDAPDLRQQPWGLEAKSELEKMTLGQQVLLEFDAQAKDSYDRLLGYIWQDRTLINEELIKQGYVLASEKVPNTKYSDRLANTQEWARLMGKGIWNPERPMRLSPREFRRQKR